MLRKICLFCQMSSMPYVFHKANIDQDFKKGAPGGRAFGIGKGWDYFWIRRAWRAAAVRASST